MTTLVLGCGNLLREDDGAGIRAVRLLRERKLPEDVRVIEAGCPGLGLLDLLAGSDRAVIVDAVLSGARPGTLHRFGPGVLPDRNWLPLSLHGVNLVDALALGRVAVPEALPDSITIFGVEIARRGMGEGLSPEVEAALPELVEMILRELDPGRA